MLLKEFIKERFDYVFSNEFNSREILDIHHAGYKFGGSINEAWVLTKDKNKNIQVFRFFQLGLSKYSRNRYEKDITTSGSVVVYYSDTIQNCYYELNEWAAKSMRQTMLMKRISERGKNSFQKTVTYHSIIS